MRFIRQKPQYLVMLLTLLFVLIILIISRFNSQFAIDFYANGLATLLGVILGIPVALWISQHQEKLSEKERKRKILSLLLSELQDNYSVLYSLQDAEMELPPDWRTEIYEISIYLKDEVWNAFSDGGELQWIKKPELVEKIATAYFLIRTIRIFSEKYFLLSVNHAASERVIDISKVAKFPDIKRLKDKIQEEIDNTVDYLDKTIKVIQNELS